MFVLFVGSDFYLELLWYFPVVANNYLFVLTEKYTFGLWNTNWKTTSDCFWELQIPWWKLANRSNRSFWSSISFSSTSFTSCSTGLQYSSWYTIFRCPNYSTELSAGNFYIVVIVITDAFAQCNWALKRLNYTF